LRPQSARLPEEEERTSWRVGKSSSTSLARYEGLIFATGAVTLSLEVLASRIVTPYFGMSLYICAGILSITLTFLAVGYYLGGRLSQRFESERLETAFLAAPVASALSIALANTLYPVLFPRLSGTDLVLGSFVGEFVLLALPLMALLAMNPMLIALLRHARLGGDGGAGRVFFISTAGSVAGVFVTAFVFIPNLTNYRATLLLGLVLGVLVALLLFRRLRVWGRGACMPAAPSPRCCTGRSCSGRNDT
jgi:hypothetical protein